MILELAYFVILQGGICFSFSRSYEKLGAMVQRTNTNGCCDYRAMFYSAA